LLEYAANLENGVNQIEKLEAQPWQMHSLRSFFANSLPWQDVATLLYFATSAVVIAVAADMWRSKAPLAIRYSVLLIATVLVSPHVYTYELLIVAPAFLVAASLAVDRGSRARYLWPTLYAATYLPALSLLASATYVQWSVPALVGLMFALVRSTR
jgi:hypothetical protein